MIFMCGIPSETSLGLVIAQADQMGLPHVVFHQRHFAQLDMELQVAGGQVIGWMRLYERGFRLEQFTAIYTRLMNHEFLPEVENEPPGSPKRLQCQAVHNTLQRWFEIAPGRVLNRMADVGSNLSKPYQAQIIRQHGFSIPETLVTNDPDLVHEFRRKHPRLIYKSISFVRSIVQTLEEEDLARLGHIRWCPVQFQEYVDGTNVRVHVLGRQIFATAIYTSVTDYRYSRQHGEQERLEPTEIPDDVAERCIEVTKALGLHFAGVDLKITPEGQVYCLEVNPCPAFSYYELHTGQPMARAVARYLAGLDD
jgi:hypothetical protein